MLSQRPVFMPSMKYVGMPWTGQTVTQWVLLMDLAILRPEKNIFYSKTILFYSNYFCYSSSLLMFL
jgi:hypothetical protein